MTTPREQLELEIREALKAGEKQKLSTLRLLLTAVTNERIKNGKEVDETGFLRLVQKAIKQRRDSADQYRKGGREELATNEEEEAEILAAYLPPAVSEAELATAISEFITQENLSGPAAIGRVMKEMMAKYSGRTDGGTINRVARDVLSRHAE
jgi:uncharacterized protein YqeY